MPHGSYRVILRLFVAKTGLKFRLEGRDFHHHRKRKLEIAANMPLTHDAMP